MNIVTDELAFTKFAKSLEHYRLNTFPRGDASDVSNKNRSSYWSSVLLRLVFVWFNASRWDKIDDERRVTKGVMSFLLKIFTIEALSSFVSPPCARASMFVYGTTIVNNSR